MMTRPLNLFVSAVIGVLLAWPAQGAEVFKDDFEGEVLGEDWDIINPDPESYIVEDGVLLAVYAQESSIDSDELQNLFRLTTGLPKGDWQATIRLQPEIQTMREIMYFGLFQDQQNYMMATLYINNWCCYARNMSIAATKNAKGKKASFVESRPLLSSVYFTMTKLKRLAKPPSKTFALKPIVACAQGRMNQPPRTILQVCTLPTIVSSPGHGRMRFTKVASPRAVPPPRPP